MKAAKRFKPGRFGHEGSILVGVLWSLFLLASLALAIDAAITPQLGLAMRLRDRGVLHQLAKAGVQRAILELREDETENVDALNETWSANEEAFKDIALTGGVCSLEYALDGEGQEEDAKRYGLADEERRININKAPVEVLERVFEIIGETTSQTAVDIADAIIDWRDEDDDPLDNGAEIHYYETLVPAYPCKNADFDVAEELLFVRGVTPEIFDKVRDWLTVFGSGEVNINTAGPLVLRVLGAGETLAGQIVAFRNGDDGIAATEDDRVFEDAGTVVAALSGQGLSPEDQTALDAMTEDGLITVRSGFFRGQSFGRFDDEGVEDRIVFVVDRDEVIHYWRED